VDYGEVRRSGVQDYSQQGCEKVMRTFAAKPISVNGKIAGYVMDRRYGLRAALCALLLLITTQAFAQFQGGGATPPPPEPALPPPPPTAKAAGAIDLTGYWVSIIADDVRFYITPHKGDIDYLPINEEAKKVANAWDPDKDIAAGQQCRAYGAVGVMQQPGRLHIAWADDNILRIDADAGTQSRLFHFGKDAAVPQAHSLQGYSIAHWEGNGRGMRGARTPQDVVTVVTRNMTPGYIRKNGVPYSADAVLTEYFNVIQGGPNNDMYLIDLAIVDDPKYLTEPYYKSHIFKKVSDATGWDPTPCWPK
jgi:hypothetical protein